MAYVNNKETFIIAVKGDKGDAGVPESGRVGRVLKKIAGSEAEWVQGKEIIYHQSSNLYDASKQTEGTIDPHYYFGGAPYESTQFDNSYHCTAPIEVMANTTYTIGLVPALFGIVKPWDRATSGLFFYDKHGAYIGGTTENTFTTPAKAAYIRFNYARGVGVILDKLNTHCVLVVGDTLPTTHEKFNEQTLEERLEGVENPPIYYKIVGRTIYVVSKYNKNKDIVVTLACKGGNNIFDFWKVGLIENSSASVSKNISNQSYVLEGSGDWHAPFKIKAVNNADGDQPEHDYFTGGNHQYNNMGSGSTATGRTAALKFYADNRELTDGDAGYTATLKIEWTNFAQASNTTKADGSGREVIQENHRLTFNGFEWNTHIELIPLEDVKWGTWYGIQCSGLGDAYTKVKYIGGANRLVYDTDERSASGDDKCYQFVAYGDKHRIIMEIDPLYDLGKRQYAVGITKGIFAETYGKAYFSIIDGTYTFNAGEHYYLRGKYIFESV